MHNRIALLAVLTATLLFAAPAAAAPIGVSSFSITPSDPRAGAHSNVDITLAFANASDDIKGLNLRLPPGLLGNPQATPRCSVADFQADTCPANTAVGSTSVNATAYLGVIPLPLTNPGTVYNVEPGGGEPARLGIVVRPIGGILGKVFLLSPINIRDSSDFGLTAELANVPNVLTGIPLDITGLTLTLNGIVAGGRAFMTNPTTCTPAAAGVTVSSYSGAVANSRAEFTPTGCGSVPFQPSLAATADDPRTEVASAITAEIRLPGDVGGRQQSHVRRATVTLPDGVGFSPGVAEGLVPCTPEQFGYPADTPASCPDAAYLGDVAFDTPLLGTLNGTVYFARDAEHPYRLFVVATLGSVRVKLIGEVTPDPDTGRLTAVFDNLPQVPFTRFALRFKGGERAVLSTPPTCGTDPARAELVPFSGGAVAKASGAMPVSADGSGRCGIPFRPTIAAATTSQAALGTTGLTLTLGRPERDQRIGKVVTKLPRGLLGQLAKFDQCTGRAMTTGACPAETKLGTVTTVVGTGGAAPTSLSGTVYLGGPVDGSLASLVIAVPATVGPIALGTLVLQAPLTLDPLDGRVAVEATVPPAFNGIPLSVRSLELAIDRPGFLLNPSGCDQRTYDAAFEAAGGADAGAAFPYQATGCEKLSFRPKLTAKGSIKGPIRNGMAPPIKLAIKTSPSGAGLGDVSVTFPKSLQPRVARLQRVCKRRDFTARRCPANTQIGTVSAKTPLIKETLRGPVYLADTGARQPQLPGLELPWAVAYLRGPGVDLRVDGRLRVLPRGAMLQGTFNNLPDVPLSSFNLSFRGGRDGSFLVARNPCKTTSPRIRASLIAQNARKLRQLPRPKLSGCNRGYKKGRPPSNSTD